MPAVAVSTCLGPRPRAQRSKNHLNTHNIKSDRPSLCAFYPKMTGTYLMCNLISLVTENWRETIKADVVSRFEIFGISTVRPSHGLNPRRHRSNMTA